MAATTIVPTTGLLNLEKELICFICTEVLYQPLTLLDCLHTFCGSCLKEWFSHQHRKACHSRTSTTSHPYTCPSCRATVKDAQRNAMINTLLEMFLAANPDKSRSEDERADMDLVYRPGDIIMPKVESRRRDRRRHDEEDLARRERRMMDEARERSLRDLGTGPQPGTTLAPRNDGRSSRSRSGSGGHEDRRERRIQEREERRQRRERAEPQARADHAASQDVEDGQNNSLSPPLSSPRHPEAVEARQRGARTVAHQASLRSLVSASDSGTGTGDSISEAQVMQEILAEGLLEGINVDALTEAEQDELSELIAERYRQLHPRRNQSTSEQRNGEPTAINTQHLQLEEADRPPQRPSGNVRPHERTARSGASSRQDERAPTSYTIGPDREQTLSPPTQGRAHRRRASDQSGRPDRTVTHTTHSTGAHGSAARSATDLTDHPRSSFSATHPRQLSDTGRAQTEPRQAVAATELWQQATHRSQSSTQQQPADPTEQADSIAQASAPEQPVANHTQANSAKPPTTILDVGASDKMAVPPPERQFEEPSISCVRCSRLDIQYDVYMYCSSCAVDLCQRCFRTGRGCNHWFGFGNSAMRHFEASMPKSTHSQAMELPHKMVGRQYMKPPSNTIQPKTDYSLTVITTSDPASRLQEGHFCDRCGAFANACFWSCDFCNEGEWGFCNDCVNTHHCCAHHPLLPIAHKLFAPQTQQKPQQGYDPHTGATHLTPSDFHASVVPSSPYHSGHSSATSSTDPTMGPQPDYVQLSILTHCDLCSKPIQPTSSRYHCPTHPTPTSQFPNSTGDYDICTSCYHNLVKTNRIARRDGPAGWRKCPSGHRMIVTKFEPDLDSASRRVILHDLVGGIKMTEEDIKTWNESVDNSKATEGPESPQRGQWQWNDPADPASDPTSASNRRTRVRQSTVGRQRRASHSKYPPDGGSGKTCIALWSYYPEEGDAGKGELLFPKRALLSEVENINDEWAEAVYAGSVGLIPRVVVREV